VARHPSPKLARSGFTLTELLVVVAILAILFLLGWLNIPKYLSQTRDATRQADIARMRVALEDYHNDKNAYPPTSFYTESGCETGAFQPYLQTLPCDPKTKKPYFYVGEGSTYILSATLENLTTTGGDAITVGSTPTDGTTPVVTEKSVVLGFLENNPPRSCTPGGCGTGFYCPRGYQCNSSGLYCVEETSCQ